MNKINHKMPSTKNFLKDPPTFPVSQEMTWVGVKAPICVLLTSCHRVSSACEVDFALQ